MKPVLLFIYFFLSGTLFSQKGNTTNYIPAEQVQKLNESELNNEFTPNVLIKKYKEIIRKCNPDKDEEVILYSLFRILVIKANDRQPDARIVEAARNCLDLVLPKHKAGAIFTYTDYGKFIEEVLIYSTNAIAWYSFQNTENITQLEQLLELVDIGCSYVRGPAHFYIFDTKVRILLKLGRKKEAYEIVYFCLTKDPYFGDFEDIKSSPEYRKWKKDEEVNLAINFSEEEKLFLKKAAEIYKNLHGQSGFSTPPDYLSTGFNKELITHADAVKKYGIPDYYDPKNLILVIHGNVLVKGDINTGWLRDQLKDMKRKLPVYGVIIDGNLFVEGEVVDDDYLILFVQKDLICNYLFSYNGLIDVGGNLYSRYGIEGEYNDGVLAVSGKVFTPYIIADDHDMPRSADGMFIYIEGGNGTEKESVVVGKSTGSGYGWGWEYFENSPHLFDPGVWTKEDYFSTDAFFEMVSSGKNPFRNQE
jgi:hypothetical protein